jgi:hypothetical protein
MQKKLNSELAQSIGQAVLQAAEIYEHETGKTAETIIIRLMGELRSPAAASSSATALNQWHISVEVQKPLRNSKS